MSSLFVPCSELFSLSLLNRGNAELHKKVVILSCLAYVRRNINGVEHKSITFANLQEPLFTSASMPITNKRKSSLKMIIEMTCVYGLRYICTKGRSNSLTETLRHQREYVRAMFLSI